jgi:hypothetical protein
MVKNENYKRGAGKPWGSEIRVNEFHRLDPNDLPEVGDWVRGARVAHELVEVVPSRTKPDTVTYRARRWLIERIPQGAKVYDSQSNLQLRGY